MVIQTKTFENEKAFQSFLKATFFPSKYHACHVISFSSAKNVPVGTPDLLLLHPSVGVSAVEVKYSKVPSTRPLLSGHPVSGSQALTLLRYSACYPNFTYDRGGAGGWVVLYHKDTHKIFAKKVNATSVDGVLEINHWSLHDWEREATWTHLLET